MDGKSLDGGFHDAPVEAARAFRAAMSAMARPGRIEPLDAATPPAPTSKAAGSLLLTLADHETGVYLAGDHDCAAMRDWLTFHTSAPLVAPQDAAFALGAWEALLPLSSYPVGTPEYPDRSTTLIVEMEDLHGEGALLKGPGIKEAARLNLPDANLMQANNRHFPLGLDFFLTCGSRVAALPRSTKVMALPRSTKVMALPRSTEVASD
ncbi:MAG: phosphonate C-P lyase system protein PhnH [Pseudomonadota bacterium]